MHMAYNINLSLRAPVHKWYFFRFPWVSIIYRFECIRNSYVIIAITLIKVSQHKLNNTVIPTNTLSFNQMKHRTTPCLVSFISVIKKDELDCFKVRTTDNTRCIINGNIKYVTHIYLMKYEKQLCISFTYFIYVNISLYINIYL